MSEAPTWFPGPIEDAWNWLDEAELPRPEIGGWVEDAVKSIGRNGKTVFDTTKDSLTWAYEHLVDLLTWPPSYVLILLLAILAWRVRSIGFAIFTMLGFLLIEALGLWVSSMQTLSLVLIATIIAVAIGIPVGIGAARSGPIRTITMPVLDIMQTMPAFVYLIPVVSFFRIGAVPGIVATVVFAMPPAVRLTILGIQQVDEEVVEAGHAFGLSPRQILFSIQLPLAKATIMAGVNQVIMLALSMVVIAGMIAAGGLGSIVYQGVSRLDVGKAFEAGLAVVILAITLDRITATFAEPLRGRSKPMNDESDEADQQTSGDADPNTVAAEPNAIAVDSVVDTA